MHRWFLCHLYLQAEETVQSSLLEIIELANGEVVLRRVDGEGEALVNIRFSPEAQVYLPDGKLDIAKAMIHAGIQAAVALSGVEAELDFVGGDEMDRVIH